ncbi:hypothetical protein AVEN_69579-1 [Araneus ventricosus]|uniref:Uncharacterized protein n=1 Tax=Araneus ventricosus TaxID=182803 RepID=A0A4Y2H9W9_ARAVE|nr:hypothetical protein AVEN_69579-1 [Araneus ventricosus]
MALEFARQGVRSPRQGERPAVRRNEYNEIGLKFLPVYYLSATVEYPVQIFSPMGGTASSMEWPCPRSPPFGSTLVAKFGFFVSNETSGSTEDEDDIFS